MRLLRTHLTPSLGILGRTGQASAAARRRVVGRHVSGPGTIRQGGRLHGGASTGPRTAAGRHKIADFHTTHGRLTKEKRKEARQQAQDGRQIRAEIREIEAESIAAGFLDKNWRKMFR